MSVKHIINNTFTNVLDEERINQIKEFLQRNLIFLILGSLCIFLAFTFDATIVTNTSGAAILALGVVLGYGFYLYIKKQLTIDRLIALIFIAGFILRLQYILYTSITARQHDVGSFGLGNGWEGNSGHAGYIEWFFYNGFSLIDADPRTLNQFYHPPFHHFIASLWMHIFTHFGSCFGMTYERAAASIQYLTLFYSSCCMFVAERIFRRLGLRKNGLVLSCALIAFHPIFILLPGSINNDILSILLIFLAVYFTICWYQNPIYLNIIGIALSVGFGMMTKLSAALIAPPIALVFLIKFLSDRKHNWKYFKQFFTFGIICIPLGLWYGLRNLIKYGIPITYVQRISETNPQYIGEYGVLERLFDFSKHPFSNVFVNLNNEGFVEYNPFVMILKSSCFGEHDFGNVNPDIIPACRILLILNVGMIFIALCATIYFLCRKNKYLTRTMKIFIGGYYFLLMFSYFNFCFEYPYTCSMDFRYIVPTVLIGSVFIGIMTESIQCCDKKQVLCRIVYYATNALTIMFMLFSTIVYIMLGM